MRATGGRRSASGVKMMSQQSLHARILQPAVNDLHPRLLTNQRLKTSESTLAAVKEFPHALGILRHQLN